MVLLDIPALSNPLGVIGFVISFIVAVCLIIFLATKTNRKFTLIFYPISFVFLFTSYLLQMDLLFVVSLVVIVVGVVMSLFINASEIRPFLTRETNLKTRKEKTAKVSQEEFYKMIGEAVRSLSRTKTGALITFEKNQNLDDIMKNGTILNAPVSFELLVTIFYPGTRLHDGAVVIRGNTIVAASVYYTPTTRALTGKYGSRHRAAVGISETSDAVTIVVSEETGRISLAYKSHLESTTYDSFLDDFIDLMNAR